MPEPGERDPESEAPQLERPAAAQTRWRLVIAYDGSGFRGFAAQPGQTTVAGSLAQALANTARLDGPPLITCAGRTDAGVHARHQVVHVDLPAILPPVRTAGAGGGDPMGPTDLLRGLNRQLAPSVVVLAAEPAPDGFDARRTATSRRYRYLVWNAATPDPLLAPVAWHVPGPLDLRQMKAGADSLLGEHDFRAFCRRAPGAPASEPIVRRVLNARWTVDPGGEGIDAGGGDGRLLRFDVEAGSFCHQMVRSMVGVLVEVGRGRCTPARVVELLRSGERSGAPDPAPPWGLCLTGVSYAEGVSDGA
jgi:tRNA pseudouridine38-40 synthase